MRFQLSPPKSSKSKVIALVLSTIFLSSIAFSSANAQLWGIKKINEEEFKKIISKLLIYNDPNFPSYNEIFRLYYTDPNKLIDALNAKIKMTPEIRKIVGTEEDLDDLTYGRYILNATYEEELIEEGARIAFAPDQANGKFFANLADNLADWKSQLGKILLEKILEGAFLVIGSPGVSIGVSTLGLATQLFVIGSGIKKINERLYERGLWHYLQCRKQLNYDHISAWDIAKLTGAGAITNKNEMQTEEYFKSLWGRYGENISDDGLKEDFKTKQRKKLKTLFLYALGAEPHPVISSPLKISPPPYRAEFTITNKGKRPIFLKTVTVGGRYGNRDEVIDFTKRHNIGLDIHESYHYQGTLALAKPGKYHFFCAYQTLDDEWNTSIDLGPGLTDNDRIGDIIVKEKEEISFKTFYYKDDSTEYSVEYPDWPVSPHIEEIKAIEKQGGKVIVVVKSAEARVAIGVFQLPRRLPSGEHTVPLQKFIRETIREAKKYRNLHSSIDLEEIKEEIGVSQILAEKISSDEDFIEAIIDKNSEYFNTYLIELDGSKIHVYAETFRLKNGKNFIVAVNAIEDKWSDYIDIAEYIIDSMQVKVIGETQVKRRSPLSPIIQTVRSFYRALDVGDIDELQKYHSPETSIEQFSIMKDINSLYSPILHHVITKMHTENLEVLHQSGIIVKPRINKEMLEYLDSSIDRVEVKEKQIEKTRNYEFANVSVKVILRPGVRQECEAELKHLRDALEGNAPLLANQPINVPWNVLIAYFPENQKVRLERYNGKWKIVDITQLK